MQHKLLNYHDSIINTQKRTISEMIIKFSKNGPDNEKKKILQCDNCGN